MNEAQRSKLYFPAWAKCAAANDWRMVGGRLAATAVPSEDGIGAWPEPARSLLVQVLAGAALIGSQQHRAMSAEDLRHSCNQVATGGRTYKTAEMTNAETNRVVCLFRLLREPEDLDAVMEWLHPEIADKRSLVSFIKKQAPEATLCEIFSNAFHTIFWEDGTTAQLKWLLGEVKGRKREWRRPAMGKLESLGVTEFESRESK